jgi:hypothetical protein
MTRDELIEAAERYVARGMSLPLDLISDLMQAGIDHTQYNVHYRESDEDQTEIHNVD